MSNNAVPLIFTCLKCKSIPKIALSSFSTLSVNCDCGYSDTIDLDTYIKQSIEINTPKKKVFCIQCQEWIRKDALH